MGKWISFGEKQQKLDNMVLDLTSQQKIKYSNHPWIKQAANSNQAINFVTMLDFLFALSNPPTPQNENDRYLLSLENGKLDYSLLTTAT